jgi:hypothetical protein
MERAIVLRDPTWIDLLFTMSEIPHAYPVKDHACEVMFRGRIVLSRLAQLGSRPVFALSSFDAAAFATTGLPSRSWLQPAKAGGARRDRTDDLMLAKHALSQLSYGPVTRRRMLHRHTWPKPVSTSPPSPVRLRRSSPRSRRPAEPKLQSSEGWWAWEDLNFRPHAYQARALTN